MQKEKVPVWEKSNLTLEEAAAYSNIGINKLRGNHERRQVRFCIVGRQQASDQAEDVRPIHGKGLFHLNNHLTKPWLKDVLQIISIQM